MAKFSVVTSELTQKAEALRNLNNTFKQQIDSLTEAEQNCCAQCKGPSIDKFNEQYQKDAEQFRLFYEGIEKFVQALEAEVREYEEKENINLDQATTRTS